MTRGTRVWAGALCAMLILSGGARATETFDVKGFGELPVLEGGRIKPVDTIARNSLLIIRGKQSLKADGRRITPAGWLLEVAAGGDRPDGYKIFLIDDPDVLGVIGREQTKERRFSFSELKPYLREISAQAGRAAQIDAKMRGRFERAVLELSSRLDRYMRIKNTLWPPGSEDPEAELKEYESLIAHRSGKGRARIMEFFSVYAELAQTALFKVLPPGEGQPPEAWNNIGEGLISPLSGGRLGPEIKAYAGMIAAYRRDDPAAFNRILSGHSAAMARTLPGAVRRARYEALFNKIQPFYLGMILYILVLFAAGISWISHRDGPRKWAFRILLAAFILHTFGLLARMILQGRPPVTNLYSSAVFTGWVAVMLSVLLERAHRNGVASALGGTIGFCTLLIAHHLSMSGDTMEMMQAVLDSNFWLATHVITIIIGYGAMFLAGAIAHVYIFLGVAKRLKKEMRLSLERMTYEVICFALFFTFVGTVLGGIWADQSWGRFWGWDPKENGALLMVLWQSAILHARWDGMIRGRGLMVMAVFGNIVTSFSWFGVNMLGVGLHSYGFMESAFYWLAAFMTVQAIVMASAFLFPSPERQRGA